MFIDTAGLDGLGELGGYRTERSLKALERADVAFLVTEPGVFGEDEKRLAAMLAEKNTPFAVVVNKIDQGDAPADFEKTIRAACGDAPPVIRVSARRGLGLDRLKEALVGLAPEDWFEEPRLLGDLLRAVIWPCWWCPSTWARPRPAHSAPGPGHPGHPGTATPRPWWSRSAELRDAFDRFPASTSLVVCDSQVVLKTAGDTTPTCP